MRREMILVKVLLCLFVLSLSAPFVLAQPAKVPKTGQTTSYVTGDDGDYEKGVAWPNPRFTDNGDGTVTDNLTGLMWTKDADFFGLISWSDAITACENLEWGSNGCNLYTDWRLPNKKELDSLIDVSNYDPALPSGHPFTEVQNEIYWSATSYARSTGLALCTYMEHGYGTVMTKTNIAPYVWPVRGGND